MKEVRKKSADPAVNKMLVKAHQQQIDLAWNRAEAMQPQCGFGRLALCCTECQEGPCRVNPFAEEEQTTICGRDRHDLATAALVKKAAEGTAALLQLAADFGADLDQSVLLAALQGDSMLGCAEAASRLNELGQGALKALQAIQAAKSSTLKADAPGTTEVNLGVLQTQAANVALYGHVSPRLVVDMAKAAQVKGVNLAVMNGNEGSGDWRLPILTNHVSQETPLLTGAIDLLVVGKQCVSPATIKLAKTMGIPVMASVELTAEGRIEAALAAALAHYQARAGKTMDIPEVKEDIRINYSAANSGELLQALRDGFAQGKVRGLVYLGGCGHIAATQDAQMVKMASELIDQGFMVATAGCAGTALAKAGLCSADRVASGLKEVLPEETPAALHLGSCHDAGEFICLAKTVAGSGLPVFALLPELAHHKNLAAALAFAAAGITTFVDAEWLGQDEQVAQILSTSFRATTGGSVSSLKDFPRGVETLAEVAATK